MSSHEATFEWPYAQASSVIVTGTFDQWSSSLSLSKDDSGKFTGKASIPWGEKIAYKFIVDGNWVTKDSEPTETDGSGNVNNVYTAPQKPEEPAQARLKDDEKPQPKRTSMVDLVSTIAARDGASSTLEYVASGVGAALRSTLGVDPYNVDKIGIPTPTDEGFPLPTPATAPAENSAKEVPPNDEPSPSQPTEPEATQAKPLVNGDAPVTSTQEEAKVPPMEPSPGPVPEAPKADPAPVVDSIDAAPLSSSPPPALNGPPKEAPLSIAESLPESQAAPIAPEQTSTPAPIAANEVTTNGTAKPEMDATTTPAVLEEAKTEAAPVPITDASTAEVLKTEEEPKKPSEVSSAEKAQENVVAPAVVPESPPAASGNGVAMEEKKQVEDAQNKSSTTERPTTPERPVTPKQKFPSATPPSPAHSKNGTVSSRKKRTSIFGRMKSVFSPGKDKDKGEKGSKSKA